MATQNVKDFNTVNLLNLRTDSILSIQNNELVRLNAANTTISGVGNFITNNINITGSFTSLNRPVINNTGVMLSGEAPPPNVESASFAWSTSYTNLINNTDNVMPLNSTLFNTDTNTYVLNNNRIGIRSTGWYEFTTNLKFYDMHTNVVFLNKLMSSSTPIGPLAIVTLMGREIGNGVAPIGGIGQPSAERGWVNTVLVQVASTGHYAIALNPNSNSPYPSNTDSSEPRVTVKKIHY